MPLCSVLELLGRFCDCVAATGASYGNDGKSLLLVRLYALRTLVYAWALTCALICYHWKSSLDWLDVLMTVLACVGICVYEFIQLRL